MTYAAGGLAVVVGKDLPAVSPPPPGIGNKLAKAAVRARRTCMMTWLQCTAFGMRRSAADGTQHLPRRPPVPRRPQRQAAQFRHRPDGGHAHRLPRHPHRHPRARGSSSSRSRAARASSARRFRCRATGWPPSPSAPNSDLLHRAQASPYTAQTTFEGSSHAQDMGITGAAAAGRLHQGLGDALCRGQRTHADRARWRRIISGRTRST